jgi:alginate O-acetyltransferase complex protein AlgI
MEFLSLPCICLIAVAFITYYLKKDLLWQKLVLLSASIIFIAYYHILYIIAAVSIALFAFYAGKYIAKHKETKTASVALAISIATLVCIWLAFRYWSPLFPLGISFYTFQALSYLIEIYWDDEQEENNLLDFTLYMLLFMKFMSGPIERGFNMLPQLKEKHPLDYGLATYGMKLATVGVFMKFVIADRLAPYLDTIFASVHNVSGIQLLEATMLYPIQLYADFAGYTSMAIGLGMMFGFKLSPNFDRPFIAQSTSELWRRWHMSLSFWVRDYIFVPLTASTRSWNKWGIYFSLIVTFVALGIWHGAGWTFAVYGLIQGIIIIYETAAHKQREYIQHKMNKKLYFIVFIIRTYVLFAISLLFFRVSNISDVFYTISHLFDGIDTSWNETNLGMSDKDWITLGIATILLFVYEYFNSKHDLIKALEKCPCTLRWSVYYVVIVGLFTFGCFGVENFIYIQF